MAKDTVKKFRVELIKIDLSLYPRHGLNDFNISRFVSALRAGAQFPPIVIEAKTHRLVDGRTRLEAFQHEELKTIDCIEKVYASEADLFADAVRLNVGHGQPLDRISVHSAIIKLTDYGYSKTSISEVVRLPVEQIEKIEKGFATDKDTGKPIALKGGLQHMRGQSLDKDQQEVNRHYSGPKALFHLRQIIGLLQTDMWPRSDEFASEMNRLCELWGRTESSGSESVAAHLDSDRSAPA